MVNSSRVGRSSEFLVGTLDKWKEKKEKEKKGKGGGNKGREDDMEGKGRRREIWEQLRRRHCQVCPEVTAHVARTTLSQIN